MKKWTVMLIPSGQGSTRNLNLYAFQVWATVGVMVVLAFCSAFFFQRNQREKAIRHQLENELQAACNILRTQKTPSGEGEFPVEEAKALLLRTEDLDQYEKSLQTVAEELSDIYDWEAEIRKVGKLPPRVKASTDFVAKAEGGKGGPPDELSEEPEMGGDDLMRPSSWIYGMSNPSADLIVQEIDLRRESLQDLLGAMEERRDRIARTPAIWPSLSSKRRKSSPFGNRLDPFTKRRAYHNGLDITAPYKSPVVATAKGRVIESTRDRYLGHVVKIDHGHGIRTVYGHMYKRLVEKGDEVERGDTLGLLGSTGRSTGPHIHYEVHKNGKAVDPDNYLGN